MNLTVEEAEVSQRKLQISDRRGDLSELPKPISKTDLLVEVTYKLGGARSTAERLLDRELLYFIDMAIFEACGALSSVCEPNDSEDQEGKLVRGKSFR